MAEVKSIVARITEKEDRLLRYLRRYEFQLKDRLEYVLKNLNYDASYLELKRFLNILEDKPFFDLETLVKMGFITQEQTENLIQGMHDNKNIIIVGKTGVGKSTLLNALL